MSGKKYCIAYGCPNRNNVPNLKFFSLPSDTERRRTWLSLLDREDLLKKDFKQAVNFVCSDHFEDFSIILTQKLKPNAVPVKISSCSPAQSTSAKNKSNVKLLSNEVMKEENPEAQSSSTQIKGLSCSCNSTKLPSSTRNECVTTETQTEKQNCVTIGIQTEEQPQPSKDEQTHTPKSFAEGTPRKRQLAEPFNMEAGKKRKKTSPEKLDSKKSISETERAKARSRKLKYLANLTEAQKALKREKDREYFRKRMEKAKRKSIEEMSENERNKTRDMWRESSKKYRQNKKTLKKGKSVKDSNTTEQNESQTSTTSANVKNVMEEINEGNNSLLVERPMAGEIQRKTWAELIGRPDLARPDTKPRSHYVCYLHFEKSVIIYKPQLHHDALPTKLLPSLPTTSSASTEPKSKKISTQTKYSNINVPSRNGTQGRREEPTLPDVEKEFEVEIEVKKETTDDPLSFDQVQVKTEPVEGEDAEDREEVPRQRFVEVPIKNEPDDSIQIEENDVTIHLKQEMEQDL